MEYLSLMNETTSMTTFTLDQLNKVFSDRLDPDNRVFNEDGVWMCQGGYEDYVRGWLDTQYNLRQTLGILTDEFVEMFDGLTEYLDENS